MGNIDSLPETEMKEEEEGLLKSCWTQPKDIKMFNKYM